MADDNSKSRDEPPARRRRPEPAFPLRPAPEKAPPLRQPSVLDGLKSQGPTTSLGEQVGRWYRNAGGLDRAADAAQEAQKNRDTKVLDGLLWPKWERDRLDRQIPVSVRHRDDVPSDVEGAYAASGPNAGSIWLRPGQRQMQASLEHEATHGAYVPNPAARARQRAKSNKSETWTRPDSKGDTEYFHYLTDPAEVDVHLAEIKRRYAHHTGNLVETPEDAKKAWDWWTAYGRNFDPAHNMDRDKQYERPAESPTMDRRDFNFYDSLPPQMKEQMLHRMPELVDRGNAIRSLVRQMG